MSVYSKLSAAMIHEVLSPTIPAVVAPGAPVISNPRRVGVNSMMYDVTWPVLNANNLQVVNLTQGVLAWLPVPSSLRDPWADASPTDGGVDAFEVAVLNRVFETLAPASAGKTSPMTLTGLPIGVLFSVKAACRS